MEKHVSVLLNESIDALNIRDDGIYLDCTLGYGGHSSEILKRIKNGYLYAFDQDINAINYSNDRLKTIGSNFKLIHDNFSNINSLDMKFDGILFDLGVSSPQLDDASRGFSYMKDARLDMRMNQDSKLSAYEVVNNYIEEELTRIFRIYSEERHARRIANEIANYRINKKIETTLELVNIIDKCIPYREKRNTHPAKKVFQAIRIEVNGEIEILEQTMRNALDMLNINGRLCVITFHSLEDRIVKKVFKEVTEEDPLTKGMPNINPKLLPDFKIVTRNAIKPEMVEIEANSRSKSASLRVIERIK